MAADVARMLALTRDELAATDVADHALEVLAASQIREIVVLGRRGPAQAAFTNPELLELGEMTDADVYVDVRDAELDPLSRAFIESEAAQVTARKNVEILTGYAGREPEGKNRRIVLRFLVSPVEILGEDRVTGIRIERNELVEDDTGTVPPAAHRRGGAIDCGIVFRSIGYHGMPSGRPALRRARGMIPNDVAASWPGRAAARRVRGRLDQAGPSGIFRTNKRDAQETVNLRSRGPRRGPPARAGRPHRGSPEALLATRPRPRDLRRLGGDRPRRALRRRAARPPAGEAGELRGTARGLPRPRRLARLRRRPPRRPARPARARARPRCR